MKPPLFLLFLLCCRLPPNWGKRPRYIDSEDDLKYVLFFLTDVDKAIKNLIKKQAKAKSLEDEEGGDGPKMKLDGKMGDSRRHGDMNDDRMPKMYGKHDHISPSSKKLHLGNSI